MNNEPPKIYVVGVGSDGLAGLTNRASELVTAAEMLVGSDSALRLLPAVHAERVRIGSDLNEITEVLQTNFGKKRIVVVATGDPLFYGVARYLCDRLGKERFEVLPHVSSMQLAFARVKESWEEAYLTDLSTRPLDDVLDRIRGAETVGLFTSEQRPPGPDRPGTARSRPRLLPGLCLREPGRQGRAHHPRRAFRNSGHDVRPAERHDPEAKARPAGCRRACQAADAASATRTTCSPRAGRRPVSSRRRKSGPSHSPNSICNPASVMWDVGAGSGSVALEAAQLVEPGRVYAIEQDSADYHLIVANAESFGVRNVQAIFGTAPAVFQGPSRSRRGFSSAATAARCPGCWKRRMRHYGQAAGWSRTSARWKC